MHFLDVAMLFFVWVGGCGVGKGEVTCGGVWREKQGKREGEREWGGVHTMDFAVMRVVAESLLNLYWVGLYSLFCALHFVRRRLWNCPVMSEPTMFGFKRAESWKISSGETEFYRDI